MTIPLLTSYFQGGGAAGADDLNTLVRGGCLNTDLQGFIGLGNMTVQTIGGNAVADGLEGLFYWNSTWTGTPDGSSVIQPPSLVEGAWLRVSSYSALTMVVFASVAAASAAAIPATVTAILLSGRYVVGDAPPAVYVRMAGTPSPVQVWQFKSADGAYWQFAEGAVYPQQMGVVGTADDSTTLSTTNACAVALGIELIIDQLHNITNAAFFNVSPRFAGVGRIKVSAVHQLYFQTGFSAPEDLWIFDFDALHTSNGGYLGVPGAPASGFVVGDMPGVTLTPYMFGAKGNNSTPDDKALDAAFLAMFATGCVLDLLGGTYLCNEVKNYDVTLRWAVGFQITGNGMASTEINLSSITSGVPFWLVRDWPHQTVTGSTNPSAILATSAAGMAVGNYINAASGVSASTTISNIVGSTVSLSAVCTASSYNVFVATSTTPVLMTTGTTNGTITVIVANPTGITIGMHVVSETGDITTQTVSNIVGATVTLSAIATSSHSNQYIAFATGAFTAHTTGTTAPLIVAGGSSIAAGNMLVSTSGDFPLNCTVASVHGTTVTTSNVPTGTHAGQTIKFGNAVAWFRPRINGFLVRTHLDDVGCKMGDDFFTDQINIVHFSDFAVFNDIGGTAHSEALRLNGVYGGQLDNCNSNCYADGLGTNYGIALNLRQVEFVDFSSGSFGNASYGVAFTAGFSQVCGFYNTDVENTGFCFSNQSPFSGKHTLVGCQISLWTNYALSAPQAIDTQTTTFRAIECNFAGSSTLSTVIIDPANYLGIVLDDLQSITAPTLLSSGTLTPNKTGKSLLVSLSGGSGTNSIVVNGVTLTSTSAGGLVVAVVRPAVSFTANYTGGATMTCLPI